MEVVTKNKARTGLMADPMAPRAFAIQRMRQETVDTFTIDLVSADGESAFAFAPGQFNMLYVFGVGEVPISISGDPTKPEVLVHTTRAVGTVTKAMRALKVGRILGVRGPVGTSWPVEKAAGKDVVIVAGGIGLAPLRPAIYYLIANRQKYGRVAILYGARTPGDLLYTGELKKWAARGDLDVHVTVDRAVGPWEGNVGVVTTMIPKASFDKNNCLAMVCGPEIMIRFTILGLQKREIADRDIYVSMERNMKCGIGLCGHCQIGPRFVCKDGPVYGYEQVRDVFTKREY